MPKSKPALELDTRQKLLDAAGRLFAERGFADVSIREICKAAGGANMAAVNYYFRDKAALYRELLQHIVDATMKRGYEHTLEAIAGKQPKEKLHVFLRLFLQDILGEEADDRCVVLGKLMNREMIDPTPDFDIVVKQGMKPRFALLSQIVGEIMERPVTDPRVLSGTQSTMGQCLIYGTTKRLSKYFAPGAQFTPVVIDGIAAQIWIYSLAGIRAIGQNRADENGWSDCGSRPKMR
ncbi:MAG: TetR/AcrR family transcriptional regulator [Terriglobia bacterium]